MSNANFGAQLSRLTIDPQAVVNNWRLIAAHLGRGTIASAVVKANAYGSGAREIASALRDAGCLDFFVATPGEALMLRDVIPLDARLYVLSGPPPGSEATFLKHRLIPVLNSVDQIAAWHEAIQGVSAPCAWHLDTGMTRLGVEMDEFGPLAAAVADGTIPPPVLLMSHLATADEPSHTLNERQLVTFREAIGLLPGVMASLAASSGIFLGPEYHFAMVRPGIALYGGNPTPDRPNPLAPVVRLQAKILQVRQIDTPKPVGYGATAHVAKGQRLATVGYGYADGYPRSASNTAAAYLAGYRLPVVGRVSMDLIVLDISEVPTDLAAPGTLVDLLGKDYGVDDLAQAASTISYEILTRLTPRGERVYGPLLSADDGASA